MRAGGENGIVLPVLITQTTSQWGVTYLPELNQTLFRLWAPAAKTLTLHVGGRAVPMQQRGNGAWEFVFDGDAEGESYYYTINGDTTALIDPYAKAVTANAREAIVVDVNRLLGPAVRLGPGPAPQDCVIYEAHVRDLTIAPENGITHKGKFLGLTEVGTRTAKGNVSGLDYLSSLGVTHVQLLPVYDFGSVDEAGDLGYNSQYNWGYDPEFYFAVEGSYSTNPEDPYVRLREFRALVDALHARGIRVIMDVVFNHVYDVERNPLAVLSGGEVFRRDGEGRWLDATGCGNETASEHPMMRQLIVDAVCYWATTFGLDGFRFDLMGIHDVETMNAVRAALDEIDPSIVLLGEGWEMGNHPDGVEPSDHRNAPLMPGIAMFNDAFRDAIKGDNFEASSPGFVTGIPAAAEIYHHMTGSRGERDYTTAAQSVVYNEAHDNLTMFDKIERSASSLIQERHMLASCIQLLSHGVMFIHAGQEFMRTKGGEHNSYNSPDEVNAFDYDRAAENATVVMLYRQLVALRRQYADTWFSMVDYEAIGRRYQLLEHSGHHLSYRVTDAFGLGRDALVFINGGEHWWDTWVADGLYEVHVNDHRVNVTPRLMALGGHFAIGPMRVVVLEHIRSY